MDKGTSGQYKPHYQREIEKDADDVSGDPYAAHNHVRDMNISHGNRATCVSGDPFVAHDNAVTGYSPDKDTRLQNERERNMSPGESKIGSSLEENRLSIQEENNVENPEFFVCTGETSGISQDEDGVYCDPGMLTQEKEYEELVARNLQLKSELHHLREVIRNQEQAILWYLQFPEIQSIAAAVFSYETDSNKE